MRKTLLSGVTIAALALSPSIAAAEDFYVSLFSGFSSLDSSDGAFDYAGGGTVGFEDEGGLLFGGAVGMHIFPNLRVEGEISFQQFDDLNNVYSAGPGTYDFGSSVEALYFLANVWYDFQVHEYVHPYVGGGIGGAWVEARSSNVAGAGPEDEDVGFAWQVGGGFRIPVAANVEFDLGYRFKSIVDLDFANVAGPGFQWSNGNLYSHSATGAIIVHFGGP